MEEHVEEYIEEESPSKGFPKPRIFDGNWPIQSPVGFDALTIYLDGRVQADLNWSKAREHARQAVDQGYALMWDMRLGLFDGLTKPLGNQSQFLSLTLSLEHFRDSLWQEFKKQTVGVSLFRGQADFTRGFPWDEHQETNLKGWLQDLGYSSLLPSHFGELYQHPEGRRLVQIFCRDVAIEYLKLLASRIPDTLPVYLFLDATCFSHSLLSQTQSLNPERFENLNLVLKGSSLPFAVLGWRNPTPYGYSGGTLCDLPSEAETTIGICLPPPLFYLSHHYSGLEEAISALNQRHLSFKLIAENQLTSQWDGLDTLIYSPGGLSSQGKRKLQGFCAAGGIVVSTGIVGELPNEISFKEWLGIQ